MNNLTTTLTKQEFRGGLLYLAFQQLLLPTLLAAVNHVLGSPLKDAAFQFAYFLINFLCICLLFHRFLLSSLKAAGKCPGKILFTAATGCVVYWFSNFVMALLIFSWKPDFYNINDSTIIAMAQDSYLLILLSTVVLAPLTEEVLFRGFLFGSLYSRSKAAGYLLSTAMFCAIHVIGYIGYYPWDTLFLCFITYIPAGLCLSWAYARTGCILTPVLMHTIINAISVFSLR